MIQSKPMPRMKRIAAASPIAPSMCGVPASNLYGSTFQVLFSKLTEEIMSPPPRNGGIASSCAVVP